VDFSSQLTVVSQQSNTKAGMWLLIEILEYGGYGMPYPYENHTPNNGRPGYILEEHFVTLSRYWR